MPSYARRHQLAQSLVYHVYNRSNGRKPIFTQDNDFTRFTALLREYREKFSLHIYHWAIMINHYHVMFEIDDPEKLSACMSGIGRAYTHYYQKAYQSAGYLWQGRFESAPIQKERYAAACGRYIERNPVSAGVVVDAWEYCHSSARYYCLGIDDGITMPDPAYIELSAEETVRRRLYTEFLRNFDYEEEGTFRKRGVIHGDESFRSRLIKDHGRYVPRRQGRVGGIFVA